jgi:hypothetical protein
LAQMNSTTYQARAVNRPALDAGIALNLHSGRQWSGASEPGRRAAPEDCTCKTL